MFGLPNVPGETFPRFNFQGGLVPVDAIGAVGNANRIASITNWDYIANFTDIRGKHTLKYGGSTAGLAATITAGPLRAVSIVKEGYRFLMMAPVQSYEHFTAAQKATGRT